MEPPQPLLLLLLCLAVASAQNFHFTREREGQGRGCRSPGGVRGECVLITRCPVLLDLLRAAPRPPGAVDFLRRSWCGSEGRYPRVCCVRGFAYTPPSSTSAPAAVTTPPRNTPPPGGAYQGHKNANLLPLADCGADFSERIFGGTEVEITEYPWLALLRYRTRDGRLLFLCGGSLINKRYVLTASHCINGKELTDYRLVGVRLGEYNTDTDKDCVEELTGDMTCADPPQDYGVETMIPHPEYGPLSANQFNDIGLLRLDRDAPDRSDYIRPICLPMGGEIQARAYVGQNLTVAGWGKTESSSASNIKLKVSVPVVSQEDCFKVYQGKREVSYATQMCAGGNAGKDSCTGDSGGPLMAVETLRGSNRNHIAGVVSYGPRVCGTEGWPGVYTRVAAYVPWILDNLKP